MHIHVYIYRDIHVFFLLYLISVPCTGALASAAIPPWPSARSSPSSTPWSRSGPWPNSELKITEKPYIHIHVCRGIDYRYRYRYIDRYR